MHKRIGDAVSTGRLFAIVVVLMLGGVWFFYPSSDSSSQNNTQATAADESTSDQFAATRGQVKRKVAQVRMPQPGAEPAAGFGANGGAVNDSQALRAFQEESTRPWTVRRAGTNEAIKTLVRGSWSSGNGSDPRGSATAFVHDYSESLLGVPAEQVRFSKEETTDRTKIVYEQVVDDTRVYGSTLTLFFEDGGMTRVQNDLIPKSPVLATAPTDFTPAQAFADFNASEGSGFENLSADSTKTVLFPGPTSLVYSYDFNVRETATGKTYRVLYDAEARALIKKLPTQLQ